MKEVRKLKNNSTKLNNKNNQLQQEIPLLRDFFYFHIYIISIIQSLLQLLFLHHLILRI